MKIIYCVTLTENENESIIRSNIKHLQKLDFYFRVIINTTKKLDFNNKKVHLIENVSDMRNSRINLHKEAIKYDADLYLVFDSDIDFTNLSSNDFKAIYAYSKKYDFISLYYKLDPPIPTFFTLSSSLNDFYNYKKNLMGYGLCWFDDSDYNVSTYQRSNKLKPNKKIEMIYYGKSLARDIWEFTKKENEYGATTGGANIYFNKNVLSKEFNWKKYKNKSLTWYDSYRTFLLSKNFKFVKIPFFVKHKRHTKDIQINWDNVVRYALGLNLYMKAKDTNWNQNIINLQIIELYFYIKGMILKIEKLKLTKNESQFMKKIKTFMSQDIYVVIERIKKWK